MESWENKRMAYIVLIFSVFSRFVPHLLHLTGANVTLMGAGLLFFGSRLRSNQRWQAVLAIIAVALSDWCLTTQVYGYPFHVASYVQTWIWYAVVLLGASALLQQKQTVLRIGAAAVGSSTGFFLLSNGLVWAKSEMYPHTAQGLGACYVAGLPFYRNDLASTLVFSAVFFALPAAVAALTHAARSAAGHGNAAV